MDQEPVVIDDDDDDVIIADDGYYSRTPPAVDTIVIDEDNDDDDVVEIKDSPIVPRRCKDSMLVGGLERLCDRIYKENKFLEKFVLSCLALENSDTMLRVINRSLLKSYKAISTQVKQSSEVDKILENALKLLSESPTCKYSHIKYVCEMFNRRKAKRRVNLTTITTDLEKRSNDNSKLFGSHKIVKLGRKKQYANDERGDVSIPVISLEDDESAMVIDDITNDSSNKENCNTDQELVNNESRVINDSVVLSKTQNEGSTLLVPQKDEDGLSDTQIEGTNIIPQKDEDPSSKIQAETSDTTNLLVPQKDEQFAVTSDLDRIKEIEKLIEQKKRSIAEVDLCEVTTDSIHSPYIKSERLKKEVVELYKELCQLVGEPPVKRHQVRLQKVKGPNNDGTFENTQGPVRRLEDFLNNNIGSGGDPPFPDFDDVVKCVKQANEEEGLGWNHIQIMREANMLFTHCGRALQRRRQRREWRDMLGLINSEEAALEDPAERDPELLARLEHNRRVAMAKENDILERFASMERSLPPMVLNPNITAESDNEHEDTETNKELQTQTTTKPDKLPENKTPIKSPLESTKVPLKDSESTNILECPMVQVKTEPEDIPSLLDDLGTNYTMSINIEDPFLIIEISDSEYECDED